MPEEKEKYASIFDASAHKKIAKPRVEEGKKSPEPAPPLTDDALQDRFAHCKELHNMMKDKVDGLFAERNITVNSMRDYFDNPSNFSPNQWRMIQEQKAEVESELTKLVPKKEAAEKKAKGKTTEKKPKAMQTKSRWIPMR